jgi:methionyl-tRNA formyltransferase
MNSNPLRAVYFSEEGSLFGKTHLAALLTCDGVKLLGVVVSPTADSEVRSQVIPGKNFRERFRNLIWRLLFITVGRTPQTDLTAFDMRVEMWIRGIATLRPDSLKASVLLERLRRLDADVFLCAGHRRIFPKKLLDMPRIAAINFHPSLLPEGRGRNPWFWTIRTGQSRTGVTAHFMVSGVDEGDMLIQKAVELTGTETYTTLYRRLSELSADLVPQVVAMLQSGTMPRIPQPEGGSRFTEPSEADYRIDWSQGAQDIERLVRAGMNDPGAFTEINRERVVVCEATLEEKETGSPGEILDISVEGALVAAGGGGLLLKRLRMQSAEMTARQVAEEKNWRVGDRFS